VLKATDPRQFRDYGLLRVTVPQGAGISFLPISGAAKRTDRVSAWGYPALLVDRDPKLQALFDGDYSSVPELVYSEGVVSVIQEVERVPIINHTAEVSHGNSGGPLIDRNGRVVGINTLIGVDDESNRQVNIALSGQDMMAYLRQERISFQEGKE
jgi:hypothetical protein